MNNHFFKILVFIQICILSHSGSSQNEKMIISDDLIKHAVPLKVEPVDKQKKIIWGNPFTRLKFGEYITLEGKRRFYTENSTSNKKSYLLNKTNNKFTFKLIDSTNHWSNVSAKTEYESLHFDDKTVFSYFFPDLDFNEPDLIFESDKLEATIKSSYNQDEWILIVNMVANETEKKLYGSALINNTTSINIRLAQSNTDKGLVVSGLEFFLNDLSVGAIYLGWNDNIVWINCNINNELKLILATAFASISSEFSDGMTLYERY